MFLGAPRQYCLAGALAVGVGVVGFAAGHTDTVNPPVVLKLASADEGPSRTGFAPVVKKVLPAVVSVESTKVSKIPTLSKAVHPMILFSANSLARRFESAVQCPSAKPRNSVNKVWARASS